MSKEDKVLFQTGIFLGSCPLPLIRRRYDDHTVLVCVFGNEVLGRVDYSNVPQVADEEYQVQNSKKEGQFSDGDWVVDRFVSSKASEENNSKMKRKNSHDKGTAYGGDLPEFIHCALHGSY